MTCSVCGIDLGHEQRSAIAGDVIVVRPASRVGQEQSVAVRQPVRLGVVAAQVLSVVERPGLRLAEIQSVVARGDVSPGVVSQSQVVLSLKVGQRRFGESPAAARSTTRCHARRYFISVPSKLQWSTVT